MDLKTLKREAKKRSPDEVPAEFIDALLKGYSDPVFFCRYFCGIDPFEGLDEKGNRIPTKGQTGWLTQNTLTPERILACGNRWGKSLIEACKHIYMMIYKVRRSNKFNHIQQYRTVNVAITIEQAKIVWEEAVRIVTSRPQLTWALAKSPTRKPFPLMQFSDGQSFTCRSTDQPANLWGPWYDFASYDEAACEKKPDETIPLLKTRLMDHDGLLDYLSTPGYTKNWYFKLVQKALNNPKDYYVQMGISAENPHVSAEARNRFAANMTEAQVAVHLRGEFIDAGGYVYKHDDIEWARRPELKFKSYIEKHKYCTGWDIATKRDCFVGITVDVSTEPMEVVAFEKFQGIPWAVVYEKIRQRHHEYKSIEFIDVTGVGDHVPEELSDIFDFIVPINFAKPKLKTTILIQSQKALEKHQIIFPHIPDLIEELTFYEWEDKNLKNDCVIAFALALYDPNVTNTTSFVSADDLVLGSPSVASEAKAEVLRGTDSCQKKR